MKATMILAVSLLLMEGAFYWLGIAPSFMIMLGVLGLATIAGIFIFSNSRASDSTPDKPQ